jgi:hypothetical protein
MPKLADSQLVILSAAARRDGGAVLPLSFRGSKMMMCSLRPVAQAVDARAVRRGIMVPNEALAPRGRQECLAPLPGSGGPRHPSFKHNPIGPELR